MADNDLDMDRIVLILARDHDVSAYVEQTGGGVATIYAGPTTTDVNGDRRHAAIAGPGSFGWGQGPSVADTSDFYVGPEDDDGDEYVAMADIGAMTEEDVAKVIAAQARKGTHVALSADEVEALGLDGTGRGITT